MYYHALLSTIERAEREQEDFGAGLSMYMVTQLQKEVRKKKNLYDSYSNGKYLVG